MPLTSANWPDLLEKGLKKYFVKKFKQVPPKHKIMFGNLQSKANQEKFSSAGAFQNWEEFDGTVNFQTNSEGYDVTLTWTEYASGFQVERALKDDEQYNMINRLPRKLGQAGARTMEEDHADLFNNGFSTVESGHTEGSAGNGQTLFNSAHTSASGGSTQDNTGTTALSPMQLETIRQNMIAFTDDEGNKIDVMPDTIIVPPAMEEVAFEINGSSQKVDTDYNNVNFHQGKWKIIVWQYLDSDKYFIADSSLMQEDILSCKRVPVEFFKDTNSTTLIAYYVGYGRWGRNWIDWRSLFGVNM